jgi:hypothetical protein
VQASNQQDIGDTSEVPVKKGHLTISNMIREVGAITKRLCKICEKVEVHDENVVICKYCSNVCFNMEAWLIAP